MNTLLKICVGKNKDFYSFYPQDFSCIVILRIKPQIEKFDSLPIASNEREDPVVPDILLILLVIKSNV
jgi:hypothetical protein